MPPQAAAAWEAEVTGFEKLGPSVQEKIQFFVNGDAGTQVCRGTPGQPLSVALMVSPDIHVCHNGKCLDINSSFGTLGLLPGCTNRLCPRHKEGGPLDVPGQWQCATCGALTCWPSLNQCYKCGQHRNAGGGSLPKLLLPGPSQRSCWCASRFPPLLLPPLLPTLALLLVVFPMPRPLPTLMVLPLLFPVWCVALWVGPLPT